MKRVIFCLLVIVLILPCMGCDLGVLVSDPDAAQAFITQRVDTALGLVADWGLYLDQFLSRLTPAA